MNTNDGIRLNKFISSSGYCSRREADKLIETNRVKVNGKKPELGIRIFSNDEVTIDGMRIIGETQSKKDRIYIVYNKPVGITCTTDQRVKGNIVDAIDHDHRIFPVGRLDKPSEGLILLTNDGDIVNKILREENAHSKEYLVTVNKPLSAEFVERMSKGVPILNTVTKPCKVVVQGKKTFKITLTQGLNRQIRRMCEYLGYEVMFLQRLRIMHIELGRLKPGQWRNVTREEMVKLNKILEHSHNEATSLKNKRSFRKKVKPANKQHARSRKPVAKNVGNYSKKKANKKKDRPVSKKPFSSAKRHK